MIWWVETDAAGIVRRWASTPMPAPWAAIEADSAPSARFVRDGTALPLPPCPGGWAVFDPAAGVWTDRRSPTEQASDAARALALARAAAVGCINAAAGAIRARVVTALPGQEMIYLRKEAEALAFVAHPDPPGDAEGFLFLAAEVGITAPTPWEVAQTVLNLSAQWQALGAALEALRLGAIRDIEAAKTTEGIAARLAQMDDGIAAFCIAWGTP